MTEGGPPIVIFGAAVKRGGVPSAALEQRVRAALGCAARNPGAWFLPTGGVGRHRPSEAAVMARLLRQAGVEPARIVPEENATDTLSSARACARLLRARGHRGRVLVATSTYHLPRCLALLRLAGFDARGCRPFAGPASHRFSVRWFWRLREAVALPYDLAIGVWLRALGRL